MARNGKPRECLKARWTVTTPEERPVFVTGNTPELGEWNTDKALPMHVQRVGRHLHDWHIEIALPCDQSLEFKFIRKSEDGEVLWEEGENRFFTPTGTDCTTHWGPFRRPHSAGNEARVD